MTDVCPSCGKAVTELKVEKKEADIKPAWSVSCPECGTNLTMIELAEMRELVPFE